MKTEIVVDVKQHLLWGNIKKMLNPLMFPLYLFGAHWYDALCAYISNELSYVHALIFMTVFLFLISVLVVWLEKRFGLDLMDLKEFSGPGASNTIPRWRILKRLMRWSTKTRKTTFWLGSILIGPPVVAALLRKDSSWKENFRYIVPGALLSVVFWVSLYTGIGIFTWEQYIKPFFGMR